VSFVLEVCCGDDWSRVGDNSHLATTGARR
jgi:hypothetical protein